MNTSIAACVFGIVATCFGSTVSAEQAAGARPLTRALANDAAVPAMMASNAYVGSTGRLVFPLEDLGWRKVKIDGAPASPKENSYHPRTPIGKAVSNLQFDIWESSRSNDTVIAFKGSDERFDWIDANLAVGVSAQYKSAKKQVLLYLKMHPDRRVMVVGHSLGGGVALSVSFWQGLPAVVFNSSPRVFDGLENNNLAADRLAIFQRGDILQKLRSRYPVFLRKVHESQIVETAFDYGGGAPHRGDLIAAGLLACADSAELKAFAANLSLPVACYLD